MTAALAAAALALLAALFDLTTPVPPRPGGVRRLLRALPAGLLAVALRLADAPPLLAVALLAWAVADATALGEREPGEAGAWAATLLASLVLAAAAWELGSIRLLLREPWRGAAAIAPALVLAATSIPAARRPTGERAVFVGAAALLSAAAGAAVGVQPNATLAAGFGAAVALAATALALALARAARPEGAAGVLERCVRSAAAFALAAPLLPWPR